MSYTGGIQYTDPNGKEFAFVKKFPTEAEALEGLFFGIVTWRHTIDIQIVIWAPNDYANAKDPYFQAYYAKGRWQLGIRPGTCLLRKTWS